jgi:hypothetical protein
VLELGLNGIFFGLNGIDFLGFLGVNPKNPKKSILFNPKKSHLILIPSVF